MTDEATTRRRDDISGEHTACPERQSNGRPLIFYSASSPNGRDKGCAVASAVLSGSLPAATRKAALRTAHTTAKRTRGFTLAELLITVGVLTVLVLLFTQLLNSAATITTLGHKQMDADSQARQLLDRLAIDFAQMVKRSDVDYYLKSSAAAPLRRAPQLGNDQVAFYSSVPGYYPSTGSQSPVSLVAYRVNAQNKLERMGKGLVWNAVSSTDTPVVFIPIPLASPLPSPLPTPMPVPSPSPAWPQAGNMTADSDYELIGPQVFRFEYYYLLKNGAFSDIPWDTGGVNNAVNGMQDIAAIVVDIAVIDPKSKVLLLDTTTPPQIAQVASQLIDWGNTTCPGCPTLTQWRTTPGLLRARWQNTLDGITSWPRPAISGIRIYERYFYLSQ